ncbi:MAG: GNAT family N-acetyltransferase [Candidatus Jordarchaeum sp.]|uniref:GNAT family N-acetyltransferase n=1 Tax=Candidatus Jordarchaeum sp. TaxID=2823881 RepID=UPI00404B115E
MASNLTYNLRNYHPGDEHQIVDLFNSAFGANDVFTPRTVEFWIWRYLKKPGFDPRGVFLAEKDGRIISSVIETLRKAKFEDKILHLGAIDDVATPPELRRRGLASKLLEQSIKYAEQKNLDGLTLFADPEGPGYKIYLRHGFIDAKRFHIYIKTFNPEKTQNLETGRKDNKDDKRFEILTYKNLKDFAEAFNKAYSHFEGFHSLSIEEMKWRLLEPVNVFFTQTWIVKKEQEIMGGGTLRIRKIIAWGSELNSAIIENVFTLKRSDGNTAKNVLRKILEEARKLECSMALCIISSDCDAKTKPLESLGFSKIAEDSQMIKCFSPFDFSKSVKRCWYEPYEHMIG